jgi:hypothetical protein
VTTRHSDVRDAWDYTISLRRKLLDGSTGPLKPPSCHHHGSHSHRAAQPFPPPIDMSAFIRMSNGRLYVLFHPQPAVRKWPGAGALVANLRVVLVDGTTTARTVTALTLGHGLCGARDCVARFYAWQSVGASVKRGVLLALTHHAPGYSA